MNEEKKDIALNYTFIIIGLVALGASYKLEATRFYIIVLFLDCLIFGTISIIRRRIVFYAFRLYGIMAIFASVFLITIGLLVFIGYFFF